MLVVEVEDRGAAGVDLFDQRLLLAGNRINRAEAFEMRFAHGRDDGDVRVGDPGEVGISPGIEVPHSTDDDVGFLFDPEA